MSTDRALSRALDRLRQGSTLVLTHTRDTTSGRSFYIWPDGIRIADETAQKLLENPRVQPLDSGLLPGLLQEIW